METFTVRKYIYLAGPISGLRTSDAEDWRALVSRNVASDIVCLSPLRDVTDFSTVSSTRTMESMYNDLLHGAQIVARDRMDVMRCDLVFVNVLGHKGTSIGTVGEIFWADAFRKPIILVRDKESVYNHAMLDAICPWKFTSIQEAVNKVNTLLSTSK